MRRVLKDLLVDLRHARSSGDLGRLVLIAYCEVRRWARQVGELEVSRHSAAMVTDQSHRSREAFLAQIDSLICELEQAQHKLRVQAPGVTSTRTHATSH